MRVRAGGCALCVLVAIFLLLSGCGARRPGSASAVQLTVLDALRPAVEQELAQAVRLEVEELRANGRWAFLTAVPTTPDGGPIDYSTTKLAVAREEGELDDWLCALLERRGGKWSVVALEIGATDAPFVDWPERFGVPRSIVMP